MWMSCVSALLILSASMAGDRRPVCAAVLPEHALAPLALPWGVLVVAHVPTVLLASRERTRHLCAATARVLVVWLAGAACAWAYTRSPSVGYALALHSAALLLGGPSDPGIVVGARADAGLRWACIGVLLTGAWQLGPPLHLVAHPEGAAALAHLVGVLAPRLGLPPARALAELLCLA
jgi:hypothetical protein